MAQERGVWVNYRRPTRAFCRGTLKRRIRPDFDTWTLGEIKPREVQRFVNALSDYSHSVLRHLRATLGRVMNMAVKWNYVSLNPVLGLELPRGLAPVRAQVLQPAEVQAIVNALARPYRTVVVIMAGTATREWELLTLKWEDVDSLNGAIHVRRLVCCRTVDSETKTGENRRDLPISERFSGRCHAASEQVQPRGIPLPDGLRKPLRAGMGEAQRLSRRG